MFIPYPGVAFLIPSSGGYHLHFVISQPLRCGESEKVLVVGITSTVVDRDFTLDRGDHEFITHKSYINYRDAQILTVEKIRQNLDTMDKGKKFILKSTASQEVVKHICRGLRESRFSRPQHRKFCKKACPRKA